MQMSTGPIYQNRYLKIQLNKFLLDQISDADVKKIDHIMDKVKLAPEAHQVG